MAGGLAYLQPAVERLQEAYGGDIQLRGPGVTGGAVVLLGGGLLGLAGAWWSVQRYLRRFRVENPARRRRPETRRKVPATD